MRATKAWRGTVCAGLLAGAVLVRAEEAPAAAPAAAPAEPAPPTPEQVAELHALASDLWDRFVPDSVKAEYELIPRDELIGLLTRVETAGRDEDLAAYAAYAPETRAAIASLRALPDFADYAEWLAQQLEGMELAGAALAQPEPPPPPKGTPAPAREPVPLYDTWRARMAGRPVPARAAEFLPTARAVFAAEGVPEALVWLAETESSFNPRARSPAGARGLFQLMPETARSLGLSLFPFDQRTHPERSARAAAVYLKSLYARFGDWPLALAAYNAGEGRVARVLKERGATDFAGIAAHLPAETRLYVPKVLATVNVRAGVAPEQLAAPR